MNETIEPTPRPLSDRDLAKLEESLRKKLSESWTGAWTLAFNDDYNESQGRHYLKQFFVKLDTEHYGNGALKRAKSCDRINGICIPEIGREKGYLHYHCLLRIPDNYPNDLRDRAKKWWEFVAPKGSIDPPTIQTPSQWLDYCLKDPRIASELVFPEEFHPRHRRF